MSTGPSLFWPHSFSTLSWYPSCFLLFDQLASLALFSHARHNLASRPFQPSFPRLGKLLPRHLHASSLTQGSYRNVALLFMPSLTSLSRIAYPATPTTSGLHSQLYLWLSHSLLFYILYVLFIYLMICLSHYKVNSKGQGSLKCFTHHCTFSI